MLGLCIVGYIFAVVFLIVGIICIAAFFTEGEGLGLGLGLLLIGSLCLWGGIAANKAGLKHYDKTTNIYSLKFSGRFTLGIGKGRYYFDVDEREDLMVVHYISVENTTLVKDNTIEQPYLFEHREQWEDSVYTLYVPEDVDIIQYSMK